jgi:ureidoglycolate hydrolase
VIKISSLSAKSFRKYGTILEQKNKKKIFSVITGDPDAKGWRIGYLIFKPAPVDSLERHPASMETFEPVSGTTVILTASQKSPEKIEAFLLDKPVCVAKNVWHAVRVISGSAEIKITENYDVESVIYKLKKPVDIAIV